MQEVPVQEVPVQEVPVQEVPVHLCFSETQNGSKCHADQYATYRRKLLAKL
jgi:hypothetical protein